MGWVSSCERKNMNLSKCRLKLVFMCLTVAIVVGCSGKIEVSGNNVTTLDNEKFVAALASEDGPLRHPLVIVDVRTEEAYKAGHIPGAIWINVADLKPRDGRLSDARNIVVYGEGWGAGRLSYSVIAAKKLHTFGYKDVFAYRDGMTRWKARGYKIEMTKEQ